MGLRWDAPLVRRLADELDEALGGERLDALRLDGAARTCAFYFRSATLAWSLHPDGGAPLLAPAARADAADLRVRGRVRRVVAPPDERILRIELLPVRGGGGPLDVIVELLGNQWNALVVDASSGRIRHALSTRRGRRPLTVGGMYQPPSPSARVGADGGLEASAWEALLQVARDGGGPAERELVRRAAWTSPINAGVLLDLPANASWRLWRALAGRDGERCDPVVLEGPRGDQPYACALPGVPSRPVASLVDGFADVAAGAPPSTVRPVHLAPELVERLDAAAEAAARKVGALEARQRSLDDPDALRARGDLLLARYGSVPRGADSVTLEGFDGEMTTVALDPARSVAENAEDHYERAGRAQRARTRLPELIRKAVARRDGLEALRSAARAGGASAEDLEAALPARPAPPSGSGGAGSSLPYRPYRSSGGLEIRVGRGSRHNDDLTFHHSAPDDVWLHARQAAGAHVILRWGRKETPPARDLAEAATLAALYSKARTSGSVPVSWTFRKYVRKPRKSPPGSVVPDRVQTVFVTPDPGVEERLRADDEDEAARRDATLDGTT